MKACLDTFSAGLAELSAFLTNADRETALVVSLLSEDRQSSLTIEEKSLLLQISQAGTGKRQYVYAVGIIGLYGLIERLVDSVIEKYVSTVSSLAAAYGDLPEPIRKHHLPFSLELIKAVAEERRRTDHTVEQVVANLHSCLSGSSAFRINTSAFVLHRGNLKLPKIQDFLTAVGVEASNRRLLVMPSLSQWFAAAEPSRDTRGIPDQDLSLLLSPIDDLVDRRNSIAHGMIDDIENVDLLTTRCKFVAAFGATLYEILQQELLRIEVSCSSAQSLGLPIEVYGGRIVCFENARCKISVGDRMVAATGDALLPYRWSVINSLEVNRVRHQTLDIIATTQFGAEVSFKALDNHHYFVLGPELTSPTLKSSND
jgi:hypothetical protein